MRYSASEKMEIIRTVEESSLGIRRMVEQIGIPRSTFYNWYDRYLSGGIEALADKKPEPGAVWNKVPDERRKQLLDMALDEPDLSPRELAVRFTSTQNYFISEATVYRVLKAHDRSNSARAKMVAINEVVVVLPCEPATATPYFIRISSASISARGITGICSCRAVTTSGLSAFTAEDTTTTSAPCICAAACP